jgi:tryptophan-rich sensory protein
VNPWIALVVALLVPQAVGMAAGAATARSVKDWYPRLRKPWFNPPRWLFAPAWFTLFVLMGIASWLVWRAGVDTPGVSLALTVYGVHLVFNGLWSVLFFGVRRPDWALIEVAFLWASVVASAWLFAGIDPLAGWLMVPYIAWVSFAAILNAAIVKLNGSGPIV